MDRRWRPSRAGVGQSDPTVSPLPHRVWPAAKAHRAMVSCDCGVLTANAALLHRANNVPLHPLVKPGQDMVSISAELSRLGRIP